jgi:hypothetical protein
MYDMIHIIETNNLFDTLQKLIIKYTRFKLINIHFVLKNNDIKDQVGFYTIEFEIHMPWRIESCFASE